jgi:hypothetical protein
VGRVGEFADDSYRIGYHSSITGRFGKVDGRAAGIRPTTSVDVGAEAVLAVANNPSDAISGRYFNGKREARANAQAYDLEARRKLRQLSMELTRLGLDPEGWTRPPLERLGGPKRSRPHSENVQDEWNPSGPFSKF